MKRAISVREGGWGDTLYSNKQYILCFNKREADGELQHLKSQWTQQVDFYQSRISAGEERWERWGAEAGSDDQVPSLEFRKFVISGAGRVLKSILALPGGSLGFLFSWIQAHFEENISIPVQVNSSCCLVLDYMKLFHRVIKKSSYNVFTAGKELMASSWDGIIAAWTDLLFYFYDVWKSNKSFYFYLDR